MKKNKLTFLVLSLSLFIASSCTNSMTLTNNNSNELKNSNIMDYNSVVIKGKVNLDNLFPENKTKNTQNFSLKSNSNDIVKRATISLIYPHDYSVPELRGVTVSSGLTDENGIFSITTNSNFNPQQGEIFIIEASKRINSPLILDAYNLGELVGLRTFIRKNESNWESISYPNIIIDNKTTALSIIQKFQNNEVTSSDTINKIEYINGNINVSDIIKNSNVVVSKDRINTVSSLVNTVLEIDKDAISSIELKSNDEYGFNFIYPDPKWEFKENGYCYDSLIFSSDITDKTRPMFGGSLGDETGSPVALYSGNGIGYVSKSNSIAGDPIILKKAPNKEIYHIISQNYQEITIEHQSLNSKFSNVPRYLLKSDGYIYDILAPKNTVGKGEYGIANPSNPKGTPAFSSLAEAGINTANDINENNYIRPVGSVYCFKYFNNVD